MNSNRSNFTFSNFNFQEESLNFKFEIYEKLSNHFMDFRNNLINSEIRALNSFISDKQFKIVETDKNIGITVCKHEIYNCLALEHLQDENIYSKIHDLSIIDINIRIKKYDTARAF